MSNHPATHIDPATGWPVIGSVWSHDDDVDFIVADVDRLGVLAQGGLIWTHENWLRRCTPHVAPVTVTDVLVFDPWPFNGAYVTLGPSVGSVDATGARYDGPDHAADRTWNHLVTFSDGTRAVTNAEGLANWRKRNEEGK